MSFSYLENIEVEIEKMDEVIQRTKHNVKNLKTKKSIAEKTIQEMAKNKGMTQNMLKIEDLRNKIDRIDNDLDTLEKRREEAQKKFEDQKERMEELENYVKLDEERLAAIQGPYERREKYKKAKIMYNNSKTLLEIDNVIFYLKLN